MLLAGIWIWIWIWIAVGVVFDVFRSSDALAVKTLTMRAGETLRLTNERAGSTHTASLKLTEGG